MWRMDDSCGNEAAKCKWELVPYMNGRCLDLGCGPWKPFPHFVGVDNNGRDGDINVPSCERLDLFSNESHNLVFSSHLLEHIDYERVPDTLIEWCRVIGHNGHLILYLPDEDEYPKVGEEGANPDHKWNVNYDKVVAAMEAVPKDWDLIEFEKCNQGNEYSLLFIFKIR